MPDLHCVDHKGVRYWTESEPTAGVVWGFSERDGGASVAPFASLNLGSHVGDHPDAVDANRAGLLDAAGLGHLRHRLVMAEQVHGDHVLVVREDTAGSGAFAVSGRGPVPGCDALITTARDVPLMLCFADCVPLVLLAPGPAVAVVHAGWRGALLGIAGKAAARLAEQAGCSAAEIRAFVGPHVCPRHYHVDDEKMSQFFNAFDTLARAESGGLDLGHVVAASLTNAGVDPCSIASLGTCTAETIDRFFSYRAEAGKTGRHGAFVCIPS
jgi:YfiH family protein